MAAKMGLKEITYDMDKTAFWDKVKSVTSVRMQTMEKLVYEFGFEVSAVRLLGGSQADDLVTKWVII